MIKKITYLLTIFISTLLFTGVGFMTSDIVFTGISLTQPVLTTGGLTPGQLPVYQYSAPELSILLINYGPDDLFTGSQVVGGVLQQGGLSTGYITCEDTATNTVLYQSPFTNSFLVQAGTQQNILPITLPQQATQTAGAVINLSCTFDYNNEFAISSTSTKTATISLLVLESPKGRFDTTLGIAKEPIKEKLDTAIPQQGAEGVQALIIKLINQVVIPLAIIVGILFALIGFYKLFLSESNEDVSKATGYIMWGVIGIIVMMIAPFLATTVYKTILNSGVNTSFSGIGAAAQLYDIILYPLLKLFIYIALGVLFILLITRVFSFLTASADEIQQRTRTIIVATLVGMIVILGSNQIIEFVYGQEATIRNQNATAVSEIGAPLFENSTIPIFYEVVRWIMGLAAFFILAIIVYHTFRMLLQPDRAEAITDIRNAVVYILIGVLVIGAGYLITNFLILT